jgi:thiol-disulfide isomerase/thioredoxin
MMLQPRFAGRALVFRSAVLLSFLLLAAACGTTSSEGPRAAATNEADASDSFRVVAYQGQALLGGEEIAFNSLLGTGTPVVLNFWAAQCPPCRAEMPWFENVARQFEGEVLLIGIDVGPFIQLGTNEQGARLLEELGITYPAVYAVDDRPLRQFQVLGMPMTVFFDGAGEVVGRHIGIMTEQQMEDEFRALAAGDG